MALPNSPNIVIFYGANEIVNRTNTTILTASCAVLFVGHECI